MRYLAVLIIACFIFGCAHNSPVNTKPGQRAGKISILPQTGDVGVHRRKGIEYKQNNEAAKACKEFYTVLGIDPSDQPAKAELIGLLIHRDHMGEALGIYNESKKYPVTDELIVMGAQLYISLADFEEAGRLIDEYKKTHPGEKRQDVALMEAQILMGEKKFGEAEKSLKQAIKDFDSPLAHIDFATLLCNMGRYKEGLKIFNEVERKISPGSEERASLYREKLKGVFLANDKKLIEETIPHFMETAVDRPEALQNIGILYYKLGYDPEKGKEYLLSAIKEDRDLEKAVVVLAEIYEHQGKEDEMVKVASRLGNRNSRLNLLKANINRRDAEPEKAEEVYRRILESHPDIKAWTPQEVETCVLYNQMLADQGRFDEAEKLIEKVQEFQADSGPLHVMKARLLGKKKDYADAEKLLISAHKFDPERPDLRVVVALAELYLEAGWDDKAEKALRQSLEMFPDLQPACIMMARLETKRGNKEKAEEWIQKLSPVNKERFRKGLKDEGFNP